MSIIFWIFSGVILAVVLGATVKASIDWYRGERIENSFKQALDLTGLPIITFYQGETKLNFLIDTGSTGCHIDSRYVPDNATIMKTAKVMGMEGNYKETNTYAIALYLNDKKYVIECMASDLTNAFDNIKQEYGVTLHGIVGSNLFSTYGAIIDFEKYVFYTKKK